MSSLIVLHGCRTIQLNQGKNTLVDEADFPLVGAKTWHFKTRGWGVYAYRNFRIPGEKGRRTHHEILHRVLLNPADDMHVDHRDGDGLNNTRENLRIATNAENKQNRRRGCGKSRFKGVFKVRYGWQAGIRIDGKRHNIGSFRTEEDAARAYDLAAEECFGEFACTNREIYGDY